MLERIRALLGPDAPNVTDDEAEAVLELARVIAHAPGSERRAAPVSAYLLGLALGGAAPESRAAFLDELVIKLETSA
jgi:hypothetical protein